MADISLTNFVCLPCKQNTYSDVVGATSYKTCSRCPRGTTSSAGSTSLDACVAPIAIESCSEGSYVVAAATSTEPSKCAKCAAGTYSTQIDAAECLGCPEGTNSRPGANSAKLCIPDTKGCAKGMYMDKDTDLCASCPGGTYQSKLGAEGADSCKKCKYSLPSQSASVSPRACGVGKTCPAGTFGLPRVIVFTADLAHVTHTMLMQVLRMKMLVLCALLVQ